MIETSLNSASLKQANLAHAILQGANLGAANLEAANLCQASLNKSEYTNISANLQGAYLKNVNLYYADLTGANLSNANFYSSFYTKTCLPAANCGATPTCASAVGATLSHTIFEGAYLNGADFSDATLQGANFSGAYLAGANFTGADLSNDVGLGLRTFFIGAFLQGTNFTSLKSTTGADFTDAVVDLTNPKGAMLLMQLDPTKNIAFPGYTQAPGSTLGCVEFNYPSPTLLPATDNSNLCPDGNNGSCSSAQWQAKSPPSPPPANCNTGTADLNWIFN